MNPNDDQSPSDRKDPVRHLARALRATTPGFEARLDDLCRRLARQGARPSPLARFIAAISPRRRSVFAAAAAAAAVAVALALMTGHRMQPVSDFAVHDPDAWYAEAVALDQSLRNVLVLVDTEAREAVTWISTEPDGGGS